MAVVPGGAEREMAAVQAHADLMELLYQCACPRIHGLFCMISENVDDMFDTATDRTRSLQHTLLEVPRWNSLQVEAVASLCSDIADGCMSVVNAILRLKARVMNDAGVSDLPAASSPHSSPPFTEVVHALMTECAVPLCAAPDYITGGASQLPAFERLVRVDRAFERAVVRLGKCVMLKCLGAEQLRAPDPSHSKRSQKADSDGSDSESSRGRRRRRHRRTDMRRDREPSDDSALMDREDDLTAIASSRRGGGGHSKQVTLGSSRTPRKGGESGTFSASGSEEGESGSEDGESSLRGRPCTRGVMEGDGRMRDL
ncbi:hypothetical protein JKP88DRAFT_273059 [Tribonema minus]|uniref:Uncharacterized protein n=1 Tax=Tribonema minus TaxID=303371 RepID=A0A836CER3_9STRA|nr:hypothetical protein JKP88DRAFT_273059 [Tribonema minus]